MSPKKEKKGKSNLKSKRKKPVCSFRINCTVPVEDKVFDTAHFEKYLHDTMKFEGRRGNLAGTVSIRRRGNTVVVNSISPISKRSLKYYTKKYLKKNQLRDWLRVVAAEKNTYDLRYFSIRGDEDEEEEDEEEED